MVVGFVNGSCEQRRSRGLTFGSYFPGNAANTCERIMQEDRNSENVGVRYTNVYRYRRIILVVCCYKQKKSPKKCITKENQFFSKFSMGGSLGQKRGFERRALL